MSRRETRNARRAWGLYSFGDEGARTGRLVNMSKSRAEVPWAESALLTGPTTLDGPSVRRH